MRKKFSGNYRHPYLDYKSKGVFMITMKKLDHIPVFSRLVINKRFSDPSGMVSPRFSDLGQVIRRSLLEFQDRYEKIGILQYAIMPDHIHFIVQIKEVLDEHLGRYLARLTALIQNKAIEERVIDPSIKYIFHKGYNDQYLNPKRSLKELIRYLNENPYRLWIRFEHPEYFRRVEAMSLFGEECRLYGNLSLLSNSFKTFVVIHRAYTQEEKAKYKDIWNYVVHNGGVLVGAFRSREEKEILYEAMENEGKVILIDEIPERERWKPGGKRFELCEKGNFLMIHPKGIDPIIKKNLAMGKTTSREECLYLNGFSERIAELTMV